MKQKPSKDPDLQEVLVKLEILKEKLHVLEKQGAEAQLLIRILVHPILMSELREVFKNAKQMRAYELSNGERSTRDIGKLVNIDQKGVSNWWREWEKAKIADKAGKKGQFKARYTLLELLFVKSASKRQTSTMEEN